jgi:hypothetical protein
VAQGDFTQAPRHGRFDLITTCMAFHWFDGSLAIPAYKAASTPGAIWLIYNFAFGGHTTSEPFNQWFYSTYLKSYPSPPRNKTRDVTPEGDMELRQIAREQGWLPIQFTARSLAAYFTTQSNVELALKNGADLGEVTQHLTDTLSVMDLSGDFKYAYTYEIYQLEP